MIRRDVWDRLEVLEHVVRRTFGAEVVYDFNNFSSSIDGGGRVLKLGVKDFKKLSDDDKVPDRIFAKAVLSFYHEIRHLQQRQLWLAAAPKMLAGEPLTEDDLDGWPDDDSTRRILKYRNANKMQEFMDAIYRIDPTEQDAELYAIEMTRDFFRGYCKDIDIDKALMEVIRGGDFWYAEIGDDLDACVANLSDSLADGGKVTDFRIYGLHPKEPSMVLRNVQHYPLKVKAFDSTDLMDEKADIIADTVLAVIRNKMPLEKSGESYRKLLEAMPDGDRDDDLTVDYDIIDT